MQRRKIPANEPRKKRPILTISPFNIITHGREIFARHKLGNNLPKIALFTVPGKKKIIYPKAFLTDTKVLGANYIGRVIVGGKTYYPYPSFGFGLSK